ncbi:hypothetical protein C0J52_07865 [Blattella germanica]|nr:hypothetical protein C0J52_07865 [Blattella germanica]
MQCLNIDSLGTLRKKRLKGCPIEEEKVLQKTRRGTYDFRMYRKSVNERFDKPDDHGTSTDTTTMNMMVTNTQLKQRIY